MLRRTRHYNVFYRYQKILLLKIQNKQSLSTTTTLKTMGVYTTIMPIKATAFGQSELSFSPRWETFFVGGGLYAYPLMPRC